MAAIVADRGEVVEGTVKTVEKLAAGATWL
jgi:hypothetical protein